MKKVKFTVFLSLIFVLVLLGTTVVLAAGTGNIGAPVAPPKLPEGGYDDDYYNVGKTKLSSPFAFNLQQTLLPLDGLPDPGGGKEVYYFAFISGSPTKACFPQIFGSTTKVHGLSTVLWKWVNPGMATKTEIYDSVKYRCVEISSDGFYGLIGTKGEKFEHTYPIDEQ